MRVGIAGIMHEANTFIPKTVSLDDFRSKMLLTGAELRVTLSKAHHEVGGYFEGLDEAGIEAVPLIYGLTTPAGAVTHAALEEYVRTLFDLLDRAGKLDGLLVAPHGAAVSERERDMDGYWLSLLRQRVGPKMPIICTIDPHANLSRKMVDACNATIAYRTNPHIDQRQRGLEAARLMARTLRGEVRPTQAAAFPPVTMNIETQHTTEPPCTPMYALADAILKRPGVLSNSVVQGFPYADVEEMGSSFVVVTDNDPALAQQYADELAAYIIAHRAEFRGRMISVDDGVREALAGKGPVCVLDMGDNVGGGSPGDSTHLVHSIKRLNTSKARTFIALYDPEAAAAAFAAGVDQRITVPIGGKTDRMHGQPLRECVRVRSLHDGHFVEKLARHGGLTVGKMGPTAIVETDWGMTIQLTPTRVIPFSIRQLTSCGVEPADYQILIAKGVNAPAAAYEPVCSRLLRINTPGVTSADLSTFTYHHRRKPLYPFDEIA